jgi:hypothetical protein
VITDIATPLGRYRHENFIKSSVGQTSLDGLVGVPKLSEFEIKMLLGKVI